MFTLGITGGIGSGKTVVSTLLEAHGIPVYNSDVRAKELMLTDSIKTKIMALLGNQSYENNVLNKRFISEKVFGNEALLAQLNAIVHPEVRNDFLDWKKNQTSEIVGKEAAILFESGSYKQCDAVVLVTADEDIRLSRVMQRDGLTREQILERMRNQWSEEKKIEHADYVLYNNGSLVELEQKVHNLISELNNR